MAKEGGYGALRLKNETLEMLRDLKEAYELTYERTLTNDEFVRLLVDSVEDGDIAVWEMYGLRQMQKEEALRKVRELSAGKGTRR